MWSILALFAGFTVATNAALSKKILARLGILQVLFYRFLFSIPFFLIAARYFQPVQPTPLYWQVLAIAIPMDLLAMYLYLRAIQISPLSLTLPFAAFTPVFLLLTSFIILGETPSIIGVIGVLFIVVGTYLLNVHLSPKGFFEPFLALVRMKGPLFMLAVAFIFSISSNVSKILVRESHPLFSPFIYNIAMLMAISPIFFLRRAWKNTKNDLKAELPRFLAIGLFQMLHFIAHSSGIIQANVTYFIALKRFSILFGILYGYFVFKEVKIGEKLLGGVFMLIGAILILLTQG